MEKYKEIIEVQVQGEDKGKRVDFFLSEYLVDITRSYIQKLIDEKNIIIDNIENENSNVNPSFNLNNISNLDYNGLTQYSRSCQCYSYMDENLLEGWNFIQISLSNSFNVAAGAGIAINGSVSTQYYGNNGSNFTNNQRIGILVKLPEGKVWFSKNDSWLHGNPRDYLEGDNNTPVSANINYSIGDSITFSTYSGTKSSTTTYNIYNNKTGREFLYLQELGLVD